MKIVITGGCGYIGSNIVNRLVDHHEIIIFDNFSSSVDNNKDSVEIINCDLTNADSLSKLKINGVDAVLHLAAQSSGPKSIDIPRKDIDINVIGTLNVIDWCINNDVPKILFASSFVVCGDQDNECINEKIHCTPKSIYALSKLYCERLLDIYASHHGINWNVLRQFNVYGPGQDLTRMDQGMVSIFMKLVMDQNHIGVKGSLDRFRDFIHIDDVVTGWELCLLDKVKRNEIYNLGSGMRTTISQLIDSLASIFNKSNKLSVKQTGDTPGDILGCYADISKISNQLDFKPKYDLKSGLKNMADWARTQ